MKLDDCLLVAIRSTALCCFFVWSLYSVQLPLKDTELRAGRGIPKTEDFE